MLALPKQLGISRDLEEEQRLHAEAKLYLEREFRDKGIHASDLLDSRQAFFRIRDNVEGVEDRLVNMFLVGKLAHAFIEVIKGREDGEPTKSDAGTRYVDDIYFSPDFVDKHGIPDEVKTTRSFYLPKAAYLPDDSTFHRYIEQLMIYMCLMDVNEGRLSALFLNSKDETGRTSPQFYVWKIKADPRAMKMYRKQINMVKDQLLEALRSGKFADLTLCRAWMCRDCPWWNECQPPGRYGIEKEKDWTA